MRVSHHALALLGVITLAAATAPAAAFDHTQFCQAMSHSARAARINVGTWIDRGTRNDGMEVLCERRIIHFKRYSRVEKASEAWKEARTEDWRSAYCRSSTWREAIENGWLVSATFTTAGGERVWFACQRDGSAFHRIIR